MSKNYNMPITEHIEELIQRTLISILAFVIIFALVFANIKPIVNLLQIPAQGVKFLMRHAQYYSSNNVNHQKIKLHLSI